MTYQVDLYHDICAGHRLVGHESKCIRLHGHNYRIHFVVGGEHLDSLGRVVDFFEIEAKLCRWLDDHWDHRMLIWHDDPLRRGLEHLDHESVVVVAFNPTAENMAEYLVNTVGPKLGISLSECRVEETPQCVATYTR